MKKPLLSAAVAMTLAAALPAQAAPIALTLDAGQLHFERSALPLGAINDSYLIDLAHDGLFSLTVQTGGKNPDDVVFDAIYLSLGSQRIDLTAPASSAGFETWALQPLLLEAGEWTLHVEGRDTIKKAHGAYQINGSFRVPAPQTLALALLGLVAGGLVRRRQR